MFTKALSALVFAASLVAPASASVVYNVQQSFASGAQFNGTLTFADDLRHLLDVDGQLTGSSYGNTHINWLWWSDDNQLKSPTTSSNFLMSGDRPNYTHFLSFTWDISRAPTIVFSNAGYGNTVGYEDAMTGGSLTAVGEVPEPGSIALLSLGLLGLAAARRRKGKQA